MSEQSARAAFAEQEMKYRLPADRIAAARALLDAVCAPDPRHPENVVVSVYYDTEGMDSLGEKLDSHLAKTKVRVRWYEEDGAGAAPSPAFLEIKRRFAHRREKRRVELPWDTAALASRALDDPLFAAVAARLPAEAGLGAGLAPILAVRSRRRRYLHRRSGARVSLDTEIGAARFDPRRLGRARPRPLDGAVVEVKNAAGELPPELRPLLRLGARWSSFSKYQAAF